MIKKYLLLIIFIYRFDENINSDTKPEEIVTNDEIDIAEPQEDNKDKEKDTLESFKNMSEEELASTKSSLGPTICFYITNAGFSKRSDEAKNLLQSDAHRNKSRTEANFLIKRIMVDMMKYCNDNFDFKKSGEVLQAMMAKEKDDSKPSLLEDALDYSDFSFEPYYDLKVIEFKEEDKAFKDFIESVEKQYEEKDKPKTEETKKSTTNNNKSNNNNNNSSKINVPKKSKSETVKYFFIFVIGFSVFCFLVNYLLFTKRDTGLRVRDKKAKKNK